MQEDSFWGNIFRKNPRDDEDIYTVLKQVPIFQDMDKRELKAVERILHHRLYMADEVVFNEGEPGVGMYIVLKGKVLIALGADKKALAMLTNGDFFGEMALLLESSRTASAIAKETTSLLGFFQPDLFALLETHPRTGNKILQRLAQMISERLRLVNLENRQLKNKLNELQQKAKPKE
jgi:CRP-like cAMP-binding protein